MWTQVLPLSLLVDTPMVYTYIDPFLSYRIYSLGCPCRLALWPPLFNSANHLRLCTWLKAS